MFLSRVKMVSTIFSLKQSLPQEFEEQTKENWGKIAAKVLPKHGQTHENELKQILEEKKVENEKFERVNQAFTFGVKLHNGQPDSRELYEHIKKIVSAREQLGLTKSQSLKYLANWKEGQKKIDLYTVKNRDKNKL